MAKRFFLPLLTGGLLALAAPASASTLNSADFPQGPLLGIGLAGISYDHGFGDFALGGVLGTTYNNSSQLKPGLRMIYRTFHDKDLAVGPIAGLQYDPGTPGSRAYLVPDLGVSVAYTARWTWPITLRFNVTMTTNQYQNMPMPADGSYQPTANFLQRLTFGPNTSVGLGVRLHPNFELTLGGGTWIGARLNY